MSCPRPNTVRSDPKAVGELAEPLRSRIYTAMQDAPTRGLVAVSLYRDPGRQWDLRHQRCRGRECDPACKGYPVTAVPAQLINGQWVGGSKHQHRKAADMGGRDLDWLIANRARYGLGLTVRSEDWHFEAEGTDSRTGRKIGAPTVRILPYPGTSRPPTTTEEFTMDAEAKAAFADIKKRLDAQDNAIEAARNGITVTAGKVDSVGKKVDGLKAEVVTRWGSLRGWLAAMAPKLGVTREEAVDNDPTHKK